MTHNGQRRSCLFGLTETGSVFRSTDKGDTWMDVSAGLMNRSITRLTSLGDTLVAGTCGDGVWLRPEAELSE